MLNNDNICREQSKLKKRIWAALRGKSQIEILTESRLGLVGAGIPTPPTAVQPPLERQDWFVTKMMQTLCLYPAAGLDSTHGQSQRCKLRDLLVYSLKGHGLPGGGEPTLLGLQMSDPQELGVIPRMSSAGGVSSHRKSSSSSFDPCHTWPVFIQMFSSKKERNIWQSPNKLVTSLRKFSSWNPSDADRRMLKSELRHLKIREKSVYYYDYLKLDNHHQIKNKQSAQESR